MFLFAYCYGQRHDDSAKSIKLKEKFLFVSSKFVVKEITLFSDCILFCGFILFALNDNLMTYTFQMGTAHDVFNVTPSHLGRRFADRVYKLLDN